MSRRSHAGVLLALITMTWTAVAQSPSPASRQYPEGYTSGHVTNSGRPEARVWVIAETKETNSPFIKNVVTDEQGRFTLPQVPAAGNFPGTGNRDTGGKMVKFQIRPAPLAH
jgi:hypothetical protein